ncbi:MAG: toxin HipA [Amphibacillus sp.]|nr:toxin HipA [Amphibacillus sp.]
MIDTSLWERDEKSQASGTRSKFWLIEPESNSTKHLFKIPTAGTGGHWAEFVASELGDKLGFNTAEVRLAEYNGVIGTISKNFRAKAEALYEGGDLFLARFADFDRHSLAYYELPHIIDLLAKYGLEKEFVALPVYDALIANNDRHCDNWGVLIGPEAIRLAPIYDNGSSLGFNERIDKKKKMLTDNRMLLGFCNRGKSSIGLPGRKKPKHFELLSYLQLYFPEELRTVVSRLEKLNKGMLLSIVDNIPNNVMNDLDKRWVIQLILYRKNWILNGLEGSVKI